MIQGLSIYSVCPSLYPTHTDAVDHSWSHLTHSDINIQ